jgi:hypothetical protein
MISTDDAIANQTLTGIKTNPNLNPLDPSSLFPATPPSDSPMGLVVDPTADAATSGDAMVDEMSGDLGSQIDAGLVFNNWGPTVPPAGEGLTLSGTTSSDLANRTFNGVVYASAEDAQAAKDKAEEKSAKEKAAEIASRTFGGKVYASVAEAEAAKAADLEARTFDGTVYATIAEAKAAKKAKRLAKKEEEAAAAAAAEAAAAPANELKAYGYSDIDIASILGAY